MRRSFADKAISLVFLLISLMLGILIIAGIISFVFELTKIKTGVLDIGISHELLDAIIYILILAELMHVTLDYAIESRINPREFVLVVMTAIGRKLIVLDVFKEPAEHTIAASFLFLVCIYAIKILPEESKG